MSRAQLIQITCSQVYFLPNKKKYLQLRVRVDISADALYSSDDWIDLGEDLKKWRAVVSTVMNVIFQNYGKFLDKLQKCVIRILCFWISQGYTAI